MILFETFASDSRLYKETKQTMRKLQAINWVFYYVTKEDQLTKIEFARGEFKRPAFSNYWKKLQEKFGVEYHAIGYEIATEFDLEKKLIES